MTDELDRRRDQAESEAKRRREAEASAEDDSYRTAARIRQEVGAALPSDLYLDTRIERLGHPTSGAIAETLDPVSKYKITWQSCSNLLPDSGRRL